jgi:alkanesulfonate monooxygenase SsuD/methylene tetrahydromethanopterin reductase-like flavin-dependent oxidoreductase (luciferase family)
VFSGRTIRWKMEIGILYPQPEFSCGHSDATLRRVARIGDGWVPNELIFEETRQAIKNNQNLLVRIQTRPFQHWH